MTKSKTKTLNTSTTESNTSIKDKTLFLTKLSKFLPIDWMQYFVMFLMHPFFKLSCPRLIMDMNLNQAVVLGQIAAY